MLLSEGAEKPHGVRAGLKRMLMWLLVGAGIRFIWSVASS